ncbi:MAG: hypothetical protein A4E49_00452 [Methanosaeta sp. PtaU1.Bin112]|nr:MAG: hypothetical protein A4E49_00452 [Methanosaeta sp. PtaU1.Bin112]
MIDKARVCSSQKEDLSIEHFIELIGKRIQDCDAWERKLCSQGNLKEAEKIRKSKLKMMKSLGELQRCQLLRKR